MSENLINYDAIRETIEAAFRDRRKPRRKRQFEGIERHVNSLTPQEFRVLRSRLEKMTDEDRRAWVNGIAPRN